MKIILTGGGVGDLGRDAFLRFAEEVKGGKILYIPLAEDEMTYEENFKWFREQVKPYGITDIDVVFSAKEITMQKLNAVSGIFIGGGNAFWLLKQLKESDAFANLKEIFKTDKVILGLSAGATIFGKDINSCLRDDLKIAANDKNKVELKDTLGFNLITDFSYFVHYKLKESQLEQTEEKVKRLIDTNFNLICLPEETNLLITENQIEVFGEKPAEVIMKGYRQKFFPNQKIEFDFQNRL